MERGGEADRENVKRLVRSACSFAFYSMKGRERGGEGEKDDTGEGEKGDRGGGRRQGENPMTRASYWRLVFCPVRVGEKHARGGGATRA